MDCLCVHSEGEWEDKIFKCLGLRVSRTETLLGFHAQQQSANLTQVWEAIGVNNPVERLRHLVESMSR